MADPEKRKRLEEIKRRRQELMNQLNNSKAKKEESATQKSVDEIAKETLASAKQINPTEAKEAVEQSSQFMNNLIKKKFIESLEIQKFQENYPPTIPEVYDEFAQCDEEQKGSSEDSEDEENEIKNLRPKMQYIIKRKVYNPSGPGEKEEKYDFSQKEYNVLESDDEEAIEYLEKKHDDEIIEMLKNEKKTVERALTEKEVYELFNKDVEDMSLALPNSKNLVFSSVEFFDDNCAKRAVTSLDWSQKHQELLLTGYSKGDDFNANQNNGLILLWSLAYQKGPEFTFTSQPEITSAIFHTYNPKLVVGGTVTGQILIYDTRGKSAPILKTPLGLGGNQSGMKVHSSAIVSLGCIGTTNSNHIISVSDGIICTWSLSNLTKPVKRVELKKKKIDVKSEIDEIGTMCMGIQQFETNSLLIGSDDYNIYQISLHSGENASINNIVTDFRGHQGPVYSVDVHPGDYYNTANFSHLFASSSADWTTKLWSKQQPDEPLLSLDSNDDYVYCSKWCPTKVSILATGDGSGKLDIWDFNKDIEIPLCRCNVGSEVINKMAWSADGKRLAVGNSMGKVKILRLSPEIYKSKPEDSMKFEKVIGKLLGKGHENN